MSSQISQQQELNWAEKIVLSKTFWVLFIGLMFGYPIYRSLNRTLPSELPILFKLPEYELTNENGKPFGSKELNGKVYIGSFIFTSCPSVCPKITKEMEKIQKRVRGVGNKMALVTYTVDPEIDTPEVLFKKARDIHANPHVWSFLTGKKEQLKDLLINHFKVPVGEKNPDLLDLAHSEKLVLVDTLGRIRGYYGIDTNSVNQLMIDVGLLINRPVTKEN